MDWADLIGVFGREEEGGGVRSGPGEPRTILLLHFISVRPRAPTAFCAPGVCVLLLQDLLQSCARGGRRRVEDMCYERRRGTPRNPVLQHRVRLFSLVPLVWRYSNTGCARCVYLLLQGLNFECSNFSKSETPTFSVQTLDKH